MINDKARRAADRFAIAAERLLTGDLDPEFVEDTASVVFVHGHDLNAHDWMVIANTAKKSRFDMVYLGFDQGRERSGPTRVSVFAERSGIIHTWPECDLWAPADGGPLLIMPRGLNICIGFDGRALIWHERRPTTALGEGMARAVSRLRRAAAEVTDLELAQMLRPGDRLAA